MLRITTLVENTCAPGINLDTENGLSLLLEYNGEKILFDCGQSSKFLNNADAMGVDLNAGTVVLSHGHFDHGDGFLDYLARFKGFDLYMGEAYFKARYAKEPDHMRYNGVRFSSEDLDAADIKLRIVSEDVLEIFPGAYIIKNFPRLCPFELPPERLRLKAEDGSYGPDPFDDEICMVFDTAKGLVVVVGCSHPGIVNMLQAIAERFPGKHIHAVLGGAHFRDATEPQIENAVKYIYDLGIDILGLCHCTGDMTDRVDPQRIQYSRFQTGMVKEFE